MSMRMPGGKDGHEYDAARGSTSFVTWLAQLSERQKHWEVVQYDPMSMMSMRIPEAWMVSGGRGPVEAGRQDSNSRVGAAWIVSRRDKYDVDEDAGVWVVDKYDVYQELPKSRASPIISADKH